MENSNKISACLVVYNEEKTIERCLSSIKNLVDEIIVVHDGECADRTLEIVKKYTENIFIRPHIGEAEEHRVFAMKQTSGEWILQIDGDEYFEQADLESIVALTEGWQANGFIFKWEMWDGNKPVYFNGLQKMCLFKKNTFHFLGIPHAAGQVDGKVKRVNIFLHHRPIYNNIAWVSFWKKAKKWVPIHARYFFPELVNYECFNATPDKWIDYANKITKHPLFYLVVYPLKTSLAQFKNGLWTSWVGLNLVCQTYVYYFYLHWKIWTMPAPVEKK